MSAASSGLMKANPSRSSSRKSSGKPSHAPDLRNNHSSIAHGSDMVADNLDASENNNGPGNHRLSGSQRGSSRRNWKDQQNTGKYKLIRTLGRGNFAKVKLAEHVSTGQQVAVKVIDKTELSPASLQKLGREVEIMKRLNHPNIVRLYEVIESDRHVYLVMEYAPNGEVFDFLVTNGRMKEKEARLKFRQLVSAVEYCHSKKIVHRDLKAENLLLDKDYNVKLADFGFSNFYDGETKLDTFCGSPPYAAPELFQGQKYYGPEVDVWSLGVILYTLVSGSLPFDAQHLKELQSRVIRGKYRVPFYMTTDCELLLRKLLVLNPSKRKPLKTIMTDKWLNMGYEDSILEPYIEPPSDYNDPIRLAIMQKMGFSPSEVRDALENHRFNNVTAIYLLLADPKIQQSLPTSSTRSSRGSKSEASNNTTPSKLADGDSGLPISNGLPPSVEDQEEAVSNAKTPSPAHKGSVLSSTGSPVADASLVSNEHKQPTVSWMKQSASAGPTSSTSRTDKPIDLGPSPLLPHIKLFDGNSGNNNTSTAYDSGQSSMDQSSLPTSEWIRRNNTFTTAKVHGSDPPSVNPPSNLSRAPPFSDIPTHLTTPTGSESAAKGGSANVASRNIETHLESDSEQDVPTLKPEPQTIKTIPATVYKKDNAFVDWFRRTFSCHRPRKPSVPPSPDTAPIIRVGSRTKPEVYDMLNPNQRHQFSQNSRNSSWHPKENQSSEDADNSVSSISAVSHGGTLNGSSIDTLNSDLVRRRTTNTPQPPSTPTAPLPSPANSGATRPPSPLNITTRDPRIQWSVRHKATHESDTGKPSPPNQDATTAVPELHQAKVYNPGFNRSGRFFRSFASRLTRSFRRNRHVESGAKTNLVPESTEPPSSSACQQSSADSQSASQPAAAAAAALPSERPPDVDGEPHVTNNVPGPWTTMQSTQRRPGGGSVRLMTRAPVQSVQSNRSSGDGDYSDDRETEPFLAKSIDQRGLDAIQLGRKTSPTKDASIRPAKGTADSGSPKPRRLHFYRRSLASGQDPQILLNNLVRLLNSERILYEYKTEFRLTCSTTTQQPPPQPNRSSGEEEHLLLTCDTNCDTLKWEMEVFRMGKRFGIRFKRLAGNSSALNNLRRKLSRQLVVK